MNQFIQSDALTEATWAALILLNQNVQAMIRTIGPKEILVKELHSGTWQENYPMSHAQRWETIHMTYIDAISKLMMWIERRGDP